MRYADIKIFNDLYRQDSKFEYTKVKDHNERYRKQSR